jgi:DnaJ-class molecular chaperone
VNQSTTESTTAIEAPCANCAGSGYYASALTNWDGIRCDQCSGTGRVSVTTDLIAA